MTTLSEGLLEARRLVEMAILGLRHDPVQHLPTEEKVQRAVYEALDRAIEGSRAEGGEVTVDFEKEALQLAVKAVWRLAQEATLHCCENLRKRGEITWCEEHDCSSIAEVVEPLREILGECDLIRSDRSHVCREAKTCCCYGAPDEPSPDCPIHAMGSWPPRCVVCGRFMGYTIKFFQRAERREGK